MPSIVAGVANNAICYDLMYAYLITGCFWRIACSLHVNINMQKLPISKRMVVGFSLQDHRPSQHRLEEEQTTQWPKEKVQKDKQRSTKHTYKTKDRVPRTPPKTGSKLRCSGRVSSTSNFYGNKNIPFNFLICLA
jgi:hypothetical protein